MTKQFVCRSGSAVYLDSFAKNKFSAVIFPDVHESACILINYKDESIAAIHFSDYNNPESIGAFMTSTQKTAGDISNIRIFGGYYLPYIKPLQENDNLFLAKQQIKNFGYNGGVLETRQQSGRYFYHYLIEGDHLEEVDLKNIPERQMNISNSIKKENLVHSEENGHSLLTTITTHKLFEAIKKKLRSDKNKRKKT